jgi:alcohol dehydrogenase, propanol-preferring
MESNQMNPLPARMRAMVFEGKGQPLRLREVPVPQPGPGQVMLRVRACGVCRTDLHIVDGELTSPKLPLILGHEIVGDIVARGAGWQGAEGLGARALGSGANRFAIGQRAGVPWLGWTCGECFYCRSGQENLCDRPLFTGYTIDGGFAEYTVADQRYCFALPEIYDDVAAAPLLCAGLIGYRSYRMAGDGSRLGIYGFGAAAHIIAQIAIHQGREVYAFTRPGDTDAQAFARRLGAVWAGGSDETPPERLDAALIFAPVGALVPAALAAVRKGGVVVCGGIHMSDIPRFPYHLLWGERVVRSVANLTREDGEALFAAAPRAHVHTEVTAFPLEEANEALERLRSGRLQGAAVLVP